MVSADGSTPLIVNGDRLYLHRYFMYERRLADRLLVLSGRKYDVENLKNLLDSCFGAKTDEINWQRRAAEVVVLALHVNNPDCAGAEHPFVRIGAQEIDVRLFHIERESTERLDRIE